MTVSFEEISAFVLAGGRSSRMGRNKALLEVGGMPLIERVLRTARSVSSDVAVVGDSAGLEEFGYPVFPDLFQNFGPLAGIHTSLTQSKHGRTLVLACDLPFVSSALLEMMIAQSVSADVIVPLNSAGQTEQLCSIYCRRILPVVEDLISRGVHTPRALFESVNTKTLSWEVISRLPNAERFFFNVNSPSDYGRARSIAGEA